MPYAHSLKSLALTSSALCLVSGLAMADIVHLDDVIVNGSLCAGFDCVNGESFGFDTIRLKENNLRIKAQDTSNSASFPTNDWQITFNDSANGGANKFSIDDIDGGRTPFTIEASAPSHSLYVDSAGRVGLGTSNPVVEMHVVNGDSPTLRLEQNGSSGFTPQTWDVAGNETNFFVRDATNSSKLPFKIRPGATTNSIYIDTDGDIGLTSSSPDANLHVVGSSGLLIELSDTGTAPDVGTLVAVRQTSNVNVLTPHALIENSNGTTAQRHMLSLTNKGKTYASLTDTSVTSGSNTGRQWNIFNSGGTFQITTAPGGADEEELELDAAGNLTITGSITTGGSCSVGCDAVFEDDYDILPIATRAELMYEQGYLPNVGPTAESGQYELTSKVLGMLNELEHAHIYINQLHQRIEKLEEAMDINEG